LVNFGITQFVMRKLLCMCMLVLSASVWSQLTTSTGHSPSNLVDEILHGGSISVLNISYTGSDSASGKFIGISSNLNLDSGIVLTTGTTVPTPPSLFDSSGPIGPNNHGSDGIDNAIPGYYLLDSLAGVTTYNASLLEFDFIPYGDSIFMTLVFGSEEYPEFVNGGFNDVFAVLISGPGFADTTNMALLPGSQVQISIDTVNNGQSNAGPCENCSFYVNNGTGESAPQDTDPYYIQYDGFTIPIEISSAVQCGETYHMILAIADGGDGAYDSGIFIESGSFRSNAVANFAIHQDGSPTTGTLHIDSTGAAIDSLFTSFYVVNHSGFDTTVILSRERLTIDPTWSDALCFADTCFGLGTLNSWSTTGAYTLFVPAGDSALVTPVVYTNQTTGCAIYSYQILNSCNLELSSLQITYSIGGQSCYLGERPIQEVLTEERMRLYPNPVEDKLFITWQNAVGNYEIYLLTTDGKIVLRTTSENETALLSTAELATGIYVVVLTDEAGTVEYAKIVKR
jgi:hypothetical protein